FDGATACRILVHFSHLLSAACSHPDRPLSDLAVLAAAERHQILREWNDTGGKDGGAAQIHELFARQVAVRPDSVCLVWGEEQVSYGALGRRVGRLARRLRRLGVGPESVVGVCLERKPELVVALLAVLAAGGAYLPLDPAYPPERLALMLEDAGARVVIRRADGVAVLPGTVPVCSVEEAADVADDDAGDVAQAWVRLDPENLAWLIYTSGSTGRPKGVGIRHRSASVLLAWAAGVFDPRELERVLAATSISFDLSVFELFLPLSEGGAVVLAENALALPGLGAAVTLINTVPSAMAELVRSGLPATVRTVNLAGEALSRRLVEEIYQTGSVERIYNLYGPSEDTTYSTFARIARGGSVVPIGRPILGTRAYGVADYAVQPVGVRGELWLGGTGLARGYVGRPDLTAERFVPDPFGLSPGGRLYRTGDLVRFLPTGDLEFLGRLDSQVKLRGFRIELGEIESALIGQPGVREAAVALREAQSEGGSGAGRLVAYVVPAGSRGLDAGELRSALGRRLPVHMVPTSFVELESLPRTPTGKIDRKALPSPLGQGAFGESYVAPRTPVEEVLAAVWCEFLGLERVSVEENFFELGGHSLLAVRILTRTSKALRVDLSLRDLLEDSTIAGFAVRVDLALRAGRNLSLSSLRPSRDSMAGLDRLPISFGQRQLWLLDQLEPTKAAFNLPAMIRRLGRLSIPVLKTSLNEILRRHEALRTRFPVVDGEPIQEIIARAQISLPVV